LLLLLLLLLLFRIHPHDDVHQLPLIDSPLSI
jgi:hypothetical protein